MPIEGNIGALTRGALRIIGKEVAHTRPKIIDVVKRIADNLKKPSRSDITQKVRRRKAKSFRYNTKSQEETTRLTIGPPPPDRERGNQADMLPLEKRRELCS